MEMGIAVTGCLLSTSNGSVIATAGSMTEGHADMLEDRLTTAIVAAEDSFHVLRTSTAGSSADEQSTFNRVASTAGDSQAPIVIGLGQVGGRQETC